MVLFRNINFVGPNITQDDREQSLTAEAEYILGDDDNHDTNNDQKTTEAE